jgi:signal peptidase II
MASLLGIFIAVFIVLIDQISKFLIPGRGWSYTLNPGVAFGLFSSVGGVLPVLVLLIMVLWVYRTDRLRRLRNVDWVIFGLVIGGGASNGIDRFFRGGIVDFLFLGFGPRFNFADVCIVSAVVLAIWDMIGSQRKRGIKPAS